MIVDLALVRTQKTEPVLTQEARVARDCDGRLIWEGGVFQVWAPDGADACRYDGQVVEEQIRVAVGWLSNMKGKKAKKLHKKLSKLLDAAADL